MGILSLFQRLEENSSSDLFCYSFLLDATSIISTLALTVVLYDLNGDRTEDFWTGSSKHYAYCNKAIDAKSVTPKDPFYAVVNGIVPNPYRLKLFPGYRYFLSNQDGSQYYYFL